MPCTCEFSHRTKDSTGDTSYPSDSLIEETIKCRLNSRLTSPVLLCVVRVSRWVPSKTITPGGAIFSNFVQINQAYSACIWVELNHFPTPSNKRRTRFLFRVPNAGLFVDCPSEWLLFLSRRVTYDDTRRSFISKM